MLRKSLAAVKLRRKVRHVMSIQSTPIPMYRLMPSLDGVHTHRTRRQTEHRYRPHREKRIKTYGGQPLACKYQIRRPFQTNHVHARSSHICPARSSVFARWRWETASAASIASTVAHARGPWAVMVITDWSRCVFALTHDHLLLRRCGA